MTINRENITISVDDFGVNANANNAILDLLHKKKINRIGIMIYEHVSARDIEVLLHSDIKIDLHLEIPTLHKTKKMYGSVLGRGLTFVGSLCTGRISTKKITKEWEQQIILFHEKFGRNPDGLNSHENIHLFPPFFKITCHLAQKHNIPFIRCGTHGMVFTYNITRMILHTLVQCDKKILRYFPQISSTQYLASLDWFSKKTKNITQLPAPTNTEIICHPERSEEYDILSRF